MVVRNLENINAKQLSLLVNKLNLGVLSAIEDYSHLFNYEEMGLLLDSHHFFNETLIKLNDNWPLDDLSVQKISLIEQDLKKLIFRCWNQEFQNGYNYVSWFKRDIVTNQPEIVSATFTNDYNNTFCNSRYGIKYAITVESFLGACEKDAATILQKAKNGSIYSVGKISEDIYINSYNLATPIITPCQLMNKISNYQSNYNEIILDSRYIIPISIVYKNNDDFEIVSQISEKYKIPIEYIENVSKKTA